MRKPDNPGIDITFDIDGNMIGWKQGDYEILIERSPDGSAAFWTDSHGSSGSGDLPIHDEKLLVTDLGTLMGQQPMSVQWCFDSNLVPQGDAPEAECPCCDKPLSRCACNI